MREPLHMEFQDYAAREVSALITRLASGADERTEMRIQGIKRDYEAAAASLRRQLDAQTQELDAAKGEAERLRQQFDTALETLRAEHLSTLQEQALARTELPLDELLAVFATLVDTSAPSALLTL